MTYKYYGELHNHDVRGFQDLKRFWRNTWSCREFAHRDLRSATRHERYKNIPITIRIGGLNMRGRYLDEQEGMAKFASLLLPNNPIDVDSTSIWIDLLKDKEDQLIHPPAEIYSILFFYIKYLSIQMKDRVTFESACKALIKRKHFVFQGIPDQQLGTALYFFSAIKYPKEMSKYSLILSNGSGPGTAMRQLAHLEDEVINVPVAASEFYYAILEEWCSAFKKELKYIVTHHSKTYARLWYLPVLVQDVYQRIYDGDGRFDNIEYGDDEW